jgi:hypothetical protein
LENGKRNKFFGSLKSLKNFKRLGFLCIEATDVNEGLEYLPSSLIRIIARESKELKHNHIECSAHGLEVGCKVIQDQLRPFNYDVEA